MASSSPIIRLYAEANNLAFDQTKEQRNLSLVVCAIRFYVLDASSKNILFLNGTKDQVVPFDGYDLVVTDGEVRTIFALADRRLATLIHKRIIRPGSVITRVVGRICFSERSSRHNFFLATDLSVDAERVPTFEIDIDDLGWWPNVDPVVFDEPQLSQRRNFLSPWNITDPIGGCWHVGDAVSRISDAFYTRNCSTLTQVLRDQNSRHAFMGRVFAKDRLIYYSGKRGKINDMNPCPYKFYLLIADDQTCIDVVFWGEVAVKAYCSIEIGDVVMCRPYGYKVKPFAYKQPEYAPSCFDGSIVRSIHEISINDNFPQGNFPVSVVEPAAVSQQLPPVPFNFLTIPQLNTASSALNGLKLDFAGVVLYAGRWHRETRRYFRSLSENEEENVDDGATEGIIVSSVTGDRYLEEFNTGGCWMWRWIVLTDESTQQVRVKLYCTSQPDVQYSLVPSDAVAITQLRFVVMNKSEANHLHFKPKWCLTTTNESQLVRLVDQDDSSPFLSHDRVSSILKLADNLPSRQKSGLSFGGSYDFPPYPESFEAFVEDAERFAKKSQDGAIRELLGLVYVAAPQVEALFDNLGLMEYRNLMVHGLISAVRFLPADFVVRNANVQLEEENLRGSRDTSPNSRKRKAPEVTNWPALALASDWQRRSADYKSLGIKTPHWRSFTWHWQSRWAEAVLPNCINPPQDTISLKGMTSQSTSRLHLNPFSTFTGFLHVQLQLLNQSSYVNCLLPVPEPCQLESPNEKSPGNKIIDIVNFCCRQSWESEEDAVGALVLKRSYDQNVRSFRKLFTSLSENLSQSQSVVSPPLVTAVLNCYGLGADGVEVSLKRLYNKP